MTEHDDHRVRVEGDGIRHRDLSEDTGVDEARRRFGGIDIPATLAGLLAALGATVLFAGLLGGAGSIGYQRGADADDLSIGGLVAGMLVLLMSFLIGGWVAGRMARYDGARNGFVTALWFVLLAAAVSALGAWAGDRYDFFDDVRLPQWFSDSSGPAIASAVAGIVLMLLAATVGGIVGARYHRKADALIAHTRDRGIVRSDTVGARNVVLDRSGAVRDRAAR